MIQFLITTQEIETEEDEKQLFSTLVVLSPMDNATEYEQEFAQFLRTVIERAIYVTEDENFKEEDIS